MLEIDGRKGEGGGQILRTALSLAVATNTPFRMHHIRAKRSKPGLMRQHLTCVLAARDVSGGSVTGASLRSTEITFTPGEPSSADYHFKIGTAGSAALVLQTVLPALFNLKGSRVVVEGGTHNPMAPSFDFLQHVYAPALERAGMPIDFSLDRHGFYPAGGGKITAELKAPAAWAQYRRLEPVEVTDGHVLAAVSALSISIAQRETAHALELLGWDESRGRSVQVDASGTGNFVAIDLHLSDGGREHMFAIGQKGVTAERVAAQAVDEARAFIKHGAPVGEHLADQLLLPLAMGKGGAFLTGPPSRHTLTQIETIKRFLPEREITTERVEGARRWKIEVSD